MTTPHLTGLTLTSPEELQLEWSDSATHKLPVKLLRKECPCASCREKRGKEQTPDLLPVLAIEETKPVTITGMTPVGNYAYGIVFSDGHDTGIFTLKYLRILGESEGK